MASPLALLISLLIGAGAASWRQGCAVFHAAASTLSALSMLQGMLRQAGRSDVAVEIVFPVSPEAITTDRQAGAAQVSPRLLPPGRAPCDRAVPPFLPQAEVLPRHCCPPARLPRRSTLPSLPCMAPALPLAASPHQPGLSAVH